MISTLRELWGRRELFLILVQRNLKIRYKNSALGFFWSLLSPIFLILIYSVFLGLLKVPVSLEVLVSGIIVWQFLALCLGDSLQAVMGNASLVTKSSFPRLVLPLSMVGANLVNFLLSFLVLGVYLLCFGDGGPGPLWWLPAIVATQLMLCVGLASALSAANVFFRDTEHVLSVGLLAWFFLSPAIYEVDMVLSMDLPGWLTRLYFLNPMAGILSAYRIAILDSASPGAGSVLLSCAIAWAVGLLGIAAFQRVQSRFGDEL